MDDDDATMHEKHQRLQEAAMASNDASLEEAEVELAPGDVEWGEAMGRFKAQIKQLRLGGTAMLRGLGLPLPDPKKPGFDESVRGIFDAIAKQHAPLLPAQSVETTDAEPEPVNDEPAPALPALKSEATRHLPLTRS